MPSFWSASAAGMIVAGDVDLAVAHQRGDEMRERGEVALTRRRCPGSG